MPAGPGSAVGVNGSSHHDLQSLARLINANERASDHNLGTDANWVLDAICVSRSPETGAPTYRHIIQLQDGSESVDDRGNYSVHDARCDVLSWFRRHSEGTKRRNKNESEMFTVQL